VYTIVTTKHSSSDILQHIYDEPPRHTRKGSGDSGQPDSISNERPKKGEYLTVWIGM
jgi:hypothetical protein